MTSGSGGSIRQRDGGRWEGRYRTAGRSRSVYGRTKAEVQERMRAALTASDNGIRPISSTVTVGAWLDEWLNESVATRLRPRTVDSYRETVNRYIRPAIGKVALAKLEPSHVQRMLTGLTARGDLSTTTTRYAYTVLRIALGRALKSGKVARNVATLVDVPAMVRREIKPLSGDQVRTFLRASGEDRLGPLYALAVSCGARQGELLALKWSAVDLDTGMVAIRATLQMGSRVLGEPKTARARRTLRLGAAGLSALRDQRRRQLAERLAAGSRWRDADFVFTTTIGTPLDGIAVTKALQAALKRAGVPRVTFHTFGRHGYATLMLEAGEELAIVSKVLGHANLSTTADVYAHLVPGMLERSAARMDAILDPQGEVATG